MLLSIVPTNFQSSFPSRLLSLNVLCCVLFVFVCYVALVAGGCGVWSPSAVPSGSHPPPLACMNGLWACSVATVLQRFLSLSRVSGWLSWGCCKGQVVPEGIQSAPLLWTKFMQVFFSACGGLSCARMLPLTSLRRQVPSNIYMSSQLTVCLRVLKQCSFRRSVYLCLQEGGALSSSHD
jgi:hypothetical protein